MPAGAGGATGGHDLLHPVFVHPGQFSQFVQQSFGERPIFAFKSGARFPALVHPHVLIGGHQDHLFQGPLDAGGQIEIGVGGLGPVAGFDDIRDANAVLQLGVGVAELMPATTGALKRPGQKPMDLYVEASRPKKGTNMPLPPAF